MNAGMRTPAMTTSGIATIEMMTVMGEINVTIVTVIATSGVAVVTTIVTDVAGLVAREVVATMMTTMVTMRRKGRRALMTLSCAAADGEEWGRRTATSPMP